MLKLFDNYGQTQETIEKRIAEVVNHPVTVEERKDILLNVLGMIDLTTLEGSDTSDRVISLCRQARFSAIHPGFPDAAAVCVYPSLVKTAANALKGSGIKVASVAGAFPSGQSGLQVKLAEVRYAIEEGADEIDTVISRGKLLDGNAGEVFDEISAIRDACGDVHLKVILETGELLTVPMIRKAGELAIMAGADFIKTSTGKIAVGATPVAFMVMLDTIREYLEKTGKSIGIKPAGGIRTPDQALDYSRLLLSVLGDQWFCKEYFRIGASSLANELIKESGTKFE
jgi:deoxyribose-phosphate aldolase